MPHTAPVIKPTQKAIKDYYAALETYARQRVKHETALDWVIDQYQVYTDKRSGITTDPNRPDDPQYIVRLIGQVVRVSVETVQIVTNLPKVYSAAARREPRL